MPQELSPLLYEVAGMGEPVVLMPGGLSGWRSWVPFVAPLAKKRQVVRVQIRSVELAEKGLPYPPDYGVFTERDGLLAAVDEIGLDRFDLVGWSHGGDIALVFSLAYPERVRTLTVIEPAAYWILRESGYDPEALAAAEAQDRALEGKAVTIDDLKAFLEYAGLAAPGSEVESMPSWPIWVQNRQVLSVIGTIWDHGASLEQLRALRMPVLAVKGSETTELPAAVVDQLAEIVPNGRLLTLPGDHASHLQNIDRFLAELMQHTSALPSGRGSGHIP